MKFSIEYPPACRSFWMAIALRRLRGLNGKPGTGKPGRWIG